MHILHDESAVGAAVFSGDRQHRYLLTRRNLGGTGTCCFVLLNPSTADASRNDPTISRCEGFARRLGFEELWVTNLFSLMTKDPQVLAKSTCPSKPDNEHYLFDAARNADLVIVGWGRHGGLCGRSSRVLSRMNSDCIDVYTFGITLNGEPRHPLYLPYSSPLRPFTK